MRWRSLFALLIFVWVGVVHRTVNAAASDARIVTVMLAGSDADILHFSSLLEVTLRAEHVRVRTQRLERIVPQRVSRPTRSDSEGVARLWLDCTDPDHTRLYLTTPDASRVFVREFSFEYGLDATALELLTYVSRNSIVALLAGVEVGVAREEYERDIADHDREGRDGAARVPSPESRETSRNAANRGQLGDWHLAATYELEALGASTVEHGPGAALEWESSQLSVGVAGQARFPIRVGDGPIRARLISRSARLFVARPLRLSAAASLSFAAALGFDWIRVQPEGSEGSPSSATINSNFSVVEALGRLSAGFRYRVGALEVGALAGFELGFVPARYRVVLPSGAAEDVFSPWRVRPVGVLTLGGHW